MIPIKSKTMPSILAAYKQFIDKAGTVKGVESDVLIKKILLITVRPEASTVSRMLPRAITLLQQVTNLG
jgi:hypothetical protein